MRARADGLLRQCETRNQCDKYIPGTRYIFYNFLRTLLWRGKKGLPAHIYIYRQANIFHCCTCKHSRTPHIVQLYLQAQAHSTATCPLVLGVNAVRGMYTFSDERRKQRVKSYIVGWQENIIINNNNNNNNNICTYSK